MGIDWRRVRFKPDADRAVLQRLMDQHAHAYQSVDGWDLSYRRDRVRHALSLRLHESTLVDANRRLRELTLPDEDHDSDFRLVMRVYPITHNPIFPPLVRLRAHRSFLPEQIPPQLREWQEWAEQVAAGEHDAYVRELHFYETANFLQEHWSQLRAIALESLTRTAKWAHEPARDQLRNRILNLPEPVPLPAIRIDPADRPDWRQENFGHQYPAALAQARELVELSRAWDAGLRSNLRSGYYERYYYLTLDQFRDHARDPWVFEFLAWATRCAEANYGLLLD
jgi:hypothetical protein